MLLQITIMTIVQFNNCESDYYKNCKNNMDNYGNIRYNLTVVLYLLYITILCQIGVKNAFDTLKPGWTNY